MKKFKVRFFEILCIVFLAVFIFSVTQGETYSTKTVDEVESSVLEVFSTKDLKKIKKNKLKEEFSFDFDQIDSFSYYASDSIMNVNEILIIKLKPEVNYEETEQLIMERLGKKQVLFEGYAPNESALLQSYVLKCDSGFVFYAIGEQAQQSLERFLSVV